MYLIEKIKMEFIGTFMFIFMITLSSISFTFNNIDKLSFGLSCFISYCILIWMGKSLSKSQYNPAISVFLVISGHISLIEGICFIITQLVASIFAISIIKSCLTTDNIDLINQNSLLGFPQFQYINPIKGILLEALGSFFLVFVYYMLMMENKAPKYVYAPGIAGIYLVVKLFLLDKTGGGINPSRNIALSLIGNSYSHLYIYIIGPFFGGIVGSLLSNMLLTERPRSFRFKTTQIQREIKKKSVLKSQITSENND